MKEGRPFSPLADIAASQRTGLAGPAPPNTGALDGGSYTPYSHGEGRWFNWDGKIVGA